VQAISGPSVGAAAVIGGYAPIPERLSQQNLLGRSLRANDMDRPVSHRFVEFNQKPVWWAIPANPLKHAFDALTVFLRVFDGNKTTVFFPFSNTGPTKFVVHL
jgi:hypothetical protein